MMKIFSTQLQGLFTKIMDKEEINMEDGARVLAQAILGDGNIYIHGFCEMEAILVEATVGSEPLQGVKPLFVKGELQELEVVDRVLLVSRLSNDLEAIALARTLAEKGISTVAISAVVKSEDESLADAVDVHIDSKLVKPLIPDEDGTRFGFPSILTALFAYYGLTFTLKEIIREYE